MAGFFDERVGAAWRGFEDEQQKLAEEKARAVLENPAVEGAAAGMPFFGQLRDIWRARHAIDAGLSVGTEAASQALAKAHALDNPVGRAVVGGFAKLRGLDASTPEGESPYTSIESRGQATQQVPGVKLAPLKTSDPRVSARLAKIYGPELEHWDESPEQALKTQEGRERLLTLRKLIELDPSYADRKTYWEDHIPDAPSRWLTMYGEYKQSRKEDASGNPNTWIGGVGEAVAKNAAMGAAFELPSVLAAPAGSGLAALKAATIEGSGVGLARDAVRIAANVGPHVVKAPFALAPKLTSATIGGYTGARLDPEHPLRGAAIGAGAGFLTGAAGERIVPAVGKALEGTMLARGAQYIDSAVGKVLAEDPNRWGKILGPGGYKGAGAAYSAAVNGAIGLTDEDDPIGHAVVNMAIGAALPIAVTKLTNIPFPGLNALGVKLSTPVFGAVAGAMGGPIVRSLFDIEDPGDSTIGNAAYDAAAGAALFTGGKSIGVGGIKLLEKFGATPQLDPKFLGYLQSGDMHDPAVFAAGAIPTDRARSIRNPVTGELEFDPFLSELQMRKQGMEQEKALRQLQQDQEVLRVIPPGMNTAAGRATIRPILENMDFHGNPLDTPQAAQVFSTAEPWQIEAARIYRQGDQQDLQEMIAAGYLTPEEGVQGFFPKNPDQAKIRAQLAPKSYLRQPTNITTNLLPLLEGRKPLSPVEVERARRVPGGSVARATDLGKGARSKRMTPIDLDQPLDFEFLSALKAAGEEVPPGRGDVRWLLSAHPDKFVEEAAKAGWVQFPEGITKEQISGLTEAARLAKAWDVDLKSALEIIAYGKKAEDVAVNARSLLGQMARGGEANPKEVFDPHLIARQPNSNFPTVDDPHEAFRMARESWLRKKWFGDLIEAKKTPVESPTDAFLREQNEKGLRAQGFSAESIAADRRPRPESTTTASPFQDAIDELKGFPNHQKFLASHARSVLGYRDPLDLYADSMTEAIFRDRTLFHRAAQIGRGLLYGGALGPVTKIATNVRNYFQMALAQIGLGTRSLTNGITEANRNWDKWYRMAMEDHVLDYQLDEEVGKLQREFPGTLGKISETVKKATEYLMAGQHYSETKNRVWTYTGAVQKVLEERGNFDPSYLYTADAGKARVLMALAKTDEDWERAARWIGAQSTHQFMFRYGPSGQGPLFSGDVKKFITMFSTWTANYASVMQHLAQQGYAQRIMNMAATTAAIDSLANHSLGLPRFTGYSPQGDPNNEGQFSLPFATGPYDLSLPPALRIGAGAVELGTGIGETIFGGDGRGAMREGSMQLRRNLPTLVPGGAILDRTQRSFEDMQNDRPGAAARRMMGWTAPRNWEEE